MKPDRKPSEYGGAISMRVIYVRGSCNDYDEVLRRRNVLGADVEKTVDLG